VHPYARARAPSVASETVALREGALRIVVVADTHSHPHDAAAKHIAAARPDVIAHAGDIGDYAVLDALGELAPVLAIRGNIDAPAREIPEAMTIALTDGDATLVKLLVVHIGVNGPRLRADAARLAAREGASIVLCGHSHVPFIGRDKGLTVFNPGSIGPRRFHLPIVFGVIAIDRERIRMHHVDCETGNTWLP
jgi:putative phosphoesterase